MKLKDFLFRISFFLVILIFLALTLPNLRYPGLSIDEASHGVIASYILKSTTNNRPMLIDYFIVLFNRIFPIIIGTYAGCVYSYLVFPFSCIFGLNVISLRITPIFLSMLSILFVYLTCKIWFNRRVAFLSSLLIATNLIFVQYSRVGLYRQEIFLIFFFWLGLFFFAKYSERKKSIFLYLSLYFWGAGLSTKITFLWYTIGIAAACAILQKKMNLLTSLNIKKVFIAGLSFCLGAIFIILYNISDPWITARLLARALLTHPLLVTINNSAYVTNLRVRISDLITLFKGNIVDKVDWGVPAVNAIEQISVLIAGLTIVSFISVLVATLFSKTSSVKYRILFLYIIYLCVMALTPFTLSGFHPGHIMVLLPFPQIIIALFLDYIWQWAEYKKVLLITTYSIFLVPLLSYNIWSNVYYNIEMKKSGGYRRWSTAIYELADYLQKNKISSPITFGWGLRENLIFITHNEITPLVYENFASDLSGSIADAYKQLSLKNKPIFYLTMEAGENIPYRDLFMQLAKEDGKGITLEKVFLNRAGHSVYWLYKIY